MTSNTLASRRAALANLLQCLSRDYPRAQWRIVLGANRGRDAVVWQGSRWEVLAFRTWQREPRWRATCRERGRRNSAGTKLAEHDTATDLPPAIIEGFVDFLERHPDARHAPMLRLALAELTRSQADHLIKTRCSHCGQPMPPNRSRTA